MGAMPEVSTKVDRCAGHDACAPRSFADHSPDVEAEGLAVVREGDALVAHGCPDHPAHGAVISRGFGTVTVNGRPVGYVGAGVSCPSGVVATGRGTVTVG